MHIPFEPAFQFLTFIPQNDTCARLFMAALFVIAKVYKYPKCPSIGSWFH